jgi:hypothetical protein
MAGGIRPGAGRPSGSKNKVTPEIRAMAMKHCPAALDTIVHLATNAETEATRLAAAKELLDRAYGKPRQSIAAEVSHQPREIVLWGKRVGED